MILFPSIPRYIAWTPQDTTLPQLYWNVYSNEQRIHAICRELGKVIRYADMMGVEVSNIAKALNDIQEGKLDEFITAAIAQWFEDNQPEIMQDIADINAIIGDGFTSEDTITAAINAINALIGNGFTSENTVADAIEDISNDLQTFEETTNDAIEAEANARETEDNEIKRRAFIKSNVLNAEAHFRFDYTSEGYTAAQASCVFDINDVRYYAAGVIMGNVETDLAAYVRIYRLVDGALIKTVTVGGHCNCMMYHDGKIYVSGGATTQLIYVIDVSNPDNIALETAISFAGFASRIGIGSSGWVSASKVDDGFYIAHQSDGRIWHTDNNIENETLVTTLTPRDINEGVEQNIIWIDHLQLFAFIFADRVEWYELSGELFNVTHFNRFYQFCAVNEIESISIFENGDFYFSNNHVAATAVSFQGWKISTLFKTNFNTADAPNTPNIRLGNIPGVVINSSFDLIPNLDTGYIGYTRSVYLKTPADLMGVYDAFGYNGLTITLQSDIDTPIVLNGVGATINCANHNFPGIWLSECTSFIYGYQTCYNNTGQTPIFTDNNRPTLIYTRGSRVNLSGINAKVGNKYLISSGFGLIIIPQASIDANVVYLTNNSGHIVPANVS